MAMRSRLVLLLSILPAVVAAQSGTASPSRSVGLTATRNTRIAVTLTAGGTPTVAALADNQLNAFAGGATLRTSWTLLPLITNGVALVAYFTAPTSAMVNGTAAIPASRVLMQVNGGAFAPVSGAPVAGLGTAGGTQAVFVQDFGFLNLFNTSGTRTDQLNFQLDLRGAPVTRAGTYAGTLVVRAASY